MTEKKLLDQLRDALRARHYSPRTEETYVDWNRRFILFHNKRHPKDMGVAEIQTFVNYLATERKLASSSQNQAVSAILFSIDTFFCASWIFLPILFTPNTERDCPPFSVRLRLSPSSTR